MRTYWRNNEEWRQQGLPLTTCSDEACRLYDASLSQLCGFYNEPSVGGFKNTVNKMLVADPEFVMGLVFKNGLAAASSTKTIRSDPDFENSIEKMVALAYKQQVTERERKHVNAVKLLAEGERYEACKMWRDILMENPLDLHAARESFFALAALGKHGQSRDIMARIFPYYKTSTPGYLDVRCWRAFGFEETNYLDHAEKEAKECLEMNPRYCFATHTLAHVYQEQGRNDHGSTFMESTEKDWSSCDMLANHNYWHQALMLMEKGDYEGTLGVFDSEVRHFDKDKRLNNFNKMLPRLVRRKGELELRDASSLLYRLELQGINVKDRWQDIKEVCSIFRGNHVWIFSDVHMYFTYLKSEAKDQAKQMNESLKEFIRATKNDNSKISDKVGLPLFEGLEAHANSEYDKATDLLDPIKYEIYQIGGSNVQRDLFNQVLIHSALNSSCKQHRRLGRMLLEERRSVRGEDSFAVKAFQNCMDFHIE